MCVQERYTLHFQPQLKETPGASSVVIYYLQGCIGKVHPKTFMERMFSHCECTTPSTPISTSTLPWVLCAIKTWFHFDHLTHYFFSPLAHPQQFKYHNVPIFQFAKPRFRKEDRIVGCVFQSLNIICHIQPIVSLENICSSFISKMSSSYCMKQWSWWCICSEP